MGGSLREKQFERKKEWKSNPPSKANKKLARVLKRDKRQKEENPSDHSKKKKNPEHEFPPFKNRVSSTVTFYYSANSL